MFFCFLFLLGFLCFPNGLARSARRALCGLGALGPGRALGPWLLPKNKKSPRKNKTTPKHAIVSATMGPAEALDLIGPMVV